MFGDFSAFRTLKKQYHCAAHLEHTHLFPLPQIHSIVSDCVGSLLYLTARLLKFAQQLFLSFNLQMGLFESVNGVINQLTLKLRVEYEFIINFRIDNVLNIKFSQERLYTVIFSLNNTISGASSWVSPK